MIRLTSLVPSEVAEQVVGLVLDHASSILLAVDHSATWSAQGHGGLRWTVQLLTAYAQTGLTATDWPSDASAHDAMLDVCEALYSTAGEPDFGGGDLDRLHDEADPATPIGIVLLAAHCRMTLASSPRKAVTVRELAALAGITREAVHRQDALHVEGGWVPGADARRWLAARGVAGVKP